MTQPLDLSVFRRRLAETIAWCTHSYYSDSGIRALRTAELQPAGYSNDSCPIPPPSPEVVAALADARAGLLRQQGIAVDDVPADLAGGRLIAIVYDEVLGCRSAESVTDGFFDGSDLPGWDSWLGWITDARTSPPRSLLLCYVPTELLHWVGEGIVVSPTESIRWVTDLDADLVAPLCAAGLLR